MAKNRNTNRPQISKAEKKARKRAAKADPVASLLLDPCNGDPTTPFYNGEGGYSQRFVRTINISTGATDTALTYSFFPGAMMQSQSVVTNSTTTLPGQYTSAGVAGSAFVAGNAGKYRCKAACVEMWSSQAPLNITGTVGFGVLPATTIQNGAAQSADGFNSVLQHQTKLTADVIECLWYPGNRDSDFFHYFTNPNTAMPEEAEDMNAIFFALTGLPVNTTYTFRVTWVCEWLPKVNLDISSPVVGAGNTQHTSNVVNALHQHHPGWYARLKSHGQQFAKIAGPIVKKEIGSLARTYGPAVLSGITGMLL